MLAALAMGVNLLNNAFGGSAVEDNPFSFFDGKLTLDVQDRVRWEMRENNFDFNSSRNVSTDDGWLLQRFRLGVRYEPESWLRFYAQGQDTREIWGKREKWLSFTVKWSHPKISALRNKLDYCGPQAWSRP